MKLSIDPLTAMEHEKQKLERRMKIRKNIENAFKMELSKAEILSKRSKDKEKAIKKYLLKQEQKKVRFLLIIRIYRNQIVKS